MTSATAPVSQSAAPETQRGATLEDIEEQKSEAIRAMVEWEVAINEKSSEEESLQIYQCLALWTNEFNGKGWANYPACIAEFQAADAESHGRLQAEALTGWEFLRPYLQLANRYYELAYERGAVGRALAQRAAAKQRRQATKFKKC